MSRTSSHCDPEGLFLLNHMPFVSWPRGVFFPGARMKEQPLLGVSGFVTEVKKKTNKQTSRTQDGSETWLRASIVFICDFHRHLTDQSLPSVGQEIPLTCCGKKELEILKPITAHTSHKYSFPSLSHKIYSSLPNWPIQL